MKYTYTYDSKGNLIKSRDYTPDGSLYDTYNYKYDDKGNKVEGTWYNSDGILTNKNNYKYDENGNEIELISIIFPEFNTEKKNMVFKYIKDYDDQGNVVVNSTYSNILLSKSTFKYTYDDKNNWIEIAESQDGLLKSTSKRVITYSGGKLTYPNFSKTKK